MHACHMYILHALLFERLHLKIPGTATLINNIFMYDILMHSSCRCILSVGADGVVEAREMKRHLLLAADGGEGASEVPMYRNWGLRMFHCTEYPENSMSILYYCSEDNTKHGQASASLEVLNQETERRICYK